MTGLPRTVGLAAAAAALTIGTAGCTVAANHGGGKGIILTGAYVQQPESAGKTTVGYLDITNNGTADELVSVSTSVGGTVELRGPVSGKTPVTMHTVPMIPLPADSTVELIPTSYHLLISGAGPMRDGKDIQLTFRFAHGSPITAYAIVTNPQNGGSSYFLN